MSKQDQYYSDWNATPDDEYYRDQTDHGTGSAEYYQATEYEVSPERAESRSYGSSESATQSLSSDEPIWYDDNADSDSYYEPLSSTQSGDWHDASQHQNDEYFAQDSERGFNLLFDSAIGHPDSSPETYDDYQHHEEIVDAYDQQDLVGTLTQKQKSAGIQVYQDDLMDCPRKMNGLQIPKPVTVVAVTCFLGLMGAALFQFSQPDLSAYDIVQMESYDGIQEVPEIFNLTNLDECSSLRDCIKESLNASKADIAEYTEITSAIREIPAATSAAVESSRTIPLETADSFSTATTIITTAEPGPQQLQVQVQWSNVRSAPDISGTIVTSLAKGTRVNVLSSTGNWFEIQADNNRQTRGFMHKSTVQ